MHELELKFRITPERLGDMQSAMQLQRAEHIHLRAHYFDTQEGDLARHAIALRLRLEGSSWVQTLKATGDGVLHRLEHEVEVAGSEDDVPSIDIHRHDGTAAGRALRAALKQASTPLTERYATDVQRTRCLIQDVNGTSMEAALDIGNVVAANRSSPVCELELEHKGGPVKGLFEIASAWTMHGELSLSTLSKAERGERLLRNDGEAAVVRFSEPRIGRHCDGPTLMRSLLQASLQQVVGNASELAGGATAPELIHQLRVGLRRLRTILRELRPLVRRVPAEWEQVLATTFRRLGQLRDADAVSDAVRPLLVSAGAPLVSWHHDAADDPALIARDVHFQTTLIAVLALAHADDDAFASFDKRQARKLLVDRLQKLHRHIAGDSFGFASLDGKLQHGVRKRLKRLRYLSDMTTSLWPEHALQRSMKRIGAAQDALGSHMDVAVAAAAFRKEAETQPEAWFAAGYLQARLDVTGAAAQRALVRAMAASPFWK